MRMIYSDRGRSPFAVEKPRADRDSTAGNWGAFSIETFASAGPLSFTHEDATGWLQYLQQFSDRNFWFADAGVKVWAYEEDFDNWQDRYGMDAVMAVYHSGHGTMLNDGTFVAPMGAAWDNRTDARSTTMRLGNEKVNYVFWSTCLSLRVLGGHSPVRTWAGPNLGFRMIFGFETTSIDDPNYGKYFWEEWNKNKTFTQAWLDASWRIYHNQAPSVAACGATRDEAVNRLDTERLLYRDHVSDDWWAWRWYNASATAREHTLRMPSDPVVVHLAAREPSSELVDLARAANLRDSALSEVQVDRQGVLTASQGDRHIGTGPQANRWVQLAEATRDNTTPIAEDRAVEIARDFARTHGGADDLVLEGVHTLMEQCGSTAGATEEPRRLETLVTYRQAFQGIPVITPGRGEVRVSVDNDGTVVSANISTREAMHTSSHLRTLAPDPVPGNTEQARPLQIQDPQEALTAAQRRLEGRLSLRLRDDGRSPQVRDVPDSTDVGYEIEGNEAFLAARKLVEITDESGYVTRQWVVAPLAR